MVMLFFVPGILVLGNSLYAQVLLEINLPKSVTPGHRVFAAIQTRNEFENELDPRYSRVVVPTASERNNALVRIHFPDVEPGSYVISSFLDVDGNDRLTMGLFGPREPWDIVNLVRPLLRVPRFDDLSQWISGDETFTLTLR